MEPCRRRVQTTLLSQLLKSPTVKLSVLRGRAASQSSLKAAFRAQSTRTELLGPEPKSSRLRSLTSVGDLTSHLFTLQMPSLHFRPGTPTLLKFLSDWLLLAFPPPFRSMLYPHTTANCLLPEMFSFLKALSAL